MSDEKTSQPVATPDENHATDVESVVALENHATGAEKALLENHATTEAAG